MTFVFHSLFYFQLFLYVSINQLNKTNKQTVKFVSLTNFISIRASI